MYRYIYKDLVSYLAKERAKFQEAGKSVLVKQLDAVTNEFSLHCHRGHELPPDFLFNAALGGDVYSPTNAHLVNIRYNLYMNEGKWKPDTYRILKAASDCVGKPGLLSESLIKASGIYEEKDNQWFDGVSKRNLEDLKKDLSDFISSRDYIEGDYPSRYHDVEDLDPEYKAILLTILKSNKAPIVFKETISTIDHWLESLSTTLGYAEADTLHKQTDGIKKLIAMVELCIDTSDKAEFILPKLLIGPTKREIFRIGFGDGLMNKIEETLTKLNKN